MYLFFVCMTEFIMSTPSVRLTLTIGGDWDSNGGCLLVVIVSVVVHWMGLSADAQARLVGVTSVSWHFCVTLDGEALFTHCGFFTGSCSCTTQYGFLERTRQWSLRPDLNNSSLLALYKVDFILSSRSRDWEDNSFWTKRQRREIFAITLWVLPKDASLTLCFIRSTLNRTERIGSFIPKNKNIYQKFWRYSLIVRKV